MIMVPGDTIAPPTWRSSTAARARRRESAGAPPLPLHDARERFERDYILRALAAQQGNISRTADALGVERSNLYRKMRAFGIAPARQARRTRKTRPAGGWQFVDSPAACSRESARRRTARAAGRTPPSETSAADGTRPTISLSRIDDAVARGLALDHLEDAEDRRLLVVRQVHRHLRRCRDPRARRPSP